MRRERQLEAIPGIEPFEFPLQYGGTAAGWKVRAFHFQLSAAFRKKGMGKMRKSASTKGVRRRVTRVARRAPKNKAKRNYARLFLIFLLSCALSGSITYALHSPSLLVKAVRVSGVRLSDAGVVRRICRRAVGQNILLLQKSPIIRDIASLSEVKSVRMRRSFPNRVWVDVRERRPDAVITDGSSCALAEADGYLFHLVNTPPAGLPRSFSGLPLLVVAGCDVKTGRVVSSTGARYAFEVLRRAKLQRLSVSKISG